MSSYQVTGFPCRMRAGPAQSLLCLSVAISIPRISRALASRRCSVLLQTHEIDRAVEPLSQRYHEKKMEKMAGELAKLLPRQTPRSVRPNPPTGPWVSVADGHAQTLLAGTCLAVSLPSLRLLPPCGVGVGIGEGGESNQE
ncbi:hypothetical protein BT67DRAFT_62683 [Trichocladium antarcticum]|uniref:Uncharacterized protein n=1 Tax=Trichocladium antarcticum TaxID=1450529 RepID=A0AAN6UHJ9_9PEZI|nr:hypothetical protein BT67DRAFT_62683 [Trichocladium antarcticum]